jgi:hypothetical protein
MMVPPPGKSLFTPATVVLALVTFALGAVTASLALITEWRGTTGAIEAPPVQRRVAEIQADNNQEVAQIEKEKDIEVATIQGEYEIQVAETNNKPQNQTFERLTKPMLVEPLEKLTDLRRQTERLEHELTTGVDRVTRAPLSPTERAKREQDLALLSEDIELEKRTQAKVFGDALSLFVGGFNGALFSGATTGSPAELLGSRPGQQPSTPAVRQPDYSGAVAMAALLSSMSTRKGESPPPSGPDPDLRPFRCQVKPSNCPD